MEIRQRSFKARTHHQNTPKLFDLLAKLNNDSANSQIGQRSVKMRIRADGKSKGVAVRKKNV